MNGRRVSEPKGFQRATAEQALRVLTRKDGPRRFLVADEVGLGKTVVARTIIHRMMENRRRPLVVFYFSSNLNIAHQNRAKLLELLDTEIDQNAASATADRLTLAANPANRPSHDRLHLYTLTPDTSVPMFRRRGSVGRLEERALIYRLLSSRFPSLDTTKFSNLCRGKRANQRTWASAIGRHAQIEGVRELQNQFVDTLRRDEYLKLSEIDSLSIMSAIKREKPSRLIACFRTALATAVLREIHPDLVIFDEFQKFRKLLIDPGDASPDPVTRALRGEPTADGHAVLLLSATPYRLYSSRRDEAAGQSHHREFFELIRFLFGAETNAIRGIERALQDFGARMLAKESPDFESLRKLRDKIQNRLRSVLSRTERPDELSGTADSSFNHPKSAIQPDDLRVFKHWVARLKAGQTRRKKAVDLTSFAVPYWLSIPLPIQMLGPGYVAWVRADKKQRRREEPTLRRSQRDRLEAPKQWPHPQLRVLNQVAPATRLALPWVAPSLPWWELHGPWAERESQSGKLLVFSRFKAVPPALSSLLCFNLEASFASRLRRNYQRAGDAQPLQFKADRPTLPALFFPSPTLIAFTDPRREAPSTLAEVRTSMRRQVGELLRGQFKIPIRRRGTQRPLWKLVAALEGTRERLLEESGLPSWPELRGHLREGATDQREAMREVLRKWHSCAEAGLDSVTIGEVAALAEFALAGPGVVLGRALYRFDPTCLTNDRYGALVDASWNGLRRYLNRGLFHAVLARRGQSYTSAIPEVVVAGNLESVLDEHLWIISQLDADAIERFPRNLRSILGLHEGRHRVHEPGMDNAGFLLRCHAAMPFADSKVENDATGVMERLRTDDLRRSFNSPFWPHILATTSLGQEGLDFHVWCRQLLHWDLCPSPIDLEQREGRIQRYGGLSVRTALAGKFGQQAFRSHGTKSPWIELAKVAEDAFRRDASGLSPWWCCPGEKIDRLFVDLPQSRQRNRFDQLSRLRWCYRLALGQPHQQDFMESISQLPNDGRQQFALRLSAWRDAKN